MGRFDTWLLRRILRKEVRQGYDHPVRITGLYAMINAAVRQEFREDNWTTGTAYMREWFEASLLVVFMDRS
jgi:hypothetical protein